MNSMEMSEEAVARGLAPRPGIKDAPFVIIAGNWNRRRHATIEAAAEYAARIFQGHTTNGSSTVPPSFHVVRIVADVTLEPPEPPKVKVVRYFGKPVKRRKRVAKRKTSAKREAPAKRKAKAKWPRAHSRLTQPFARGK